MTKAKKKMAGPAPLLEQIKRADLSKVYITLGAGVDPDGLASQLAAKLIVEKLGGEAHCFHRGTFNRPQNRTMKEVLGLQVKQEKDMRDDYSCYIAVDGPTVTCKGTPDFIIDHHPQTGQAKIAIDFRPIGACSSIMWEYAKAAGIDFTSEDGTRLATALAVGIMTDTVNFKSESCSNLDFDAVGDCLKNRDDKLFTAIVNYPEPSYYMDYLSHGWTNAKLENGVLVAGLGNIPEGRSGVISDCADKYARIHGTVAVFAMVNGDIDISVRSSNTSMNVDEFVRTAFGGGGGRRGAGRAKIPMPLFRDIPENMRDELFDSIYKVVAHKALQIAGDGVRTQEKLDD